MLFSVCYEERHDSSGYIESANYPSYSSSADCVYVITPPQSGSQYYKLTFESISSTSQDVKVRFYKPI